MAVSMQWKLLAAAAALSALAFGACGDDKSDGNNDKVDGGGGAGGDGGGGGGGIVPIADLDDNVAGSPCKANSDCKGTNATCGKDPSDTETVAACTGACDTDANCGVGGTCVKAITVGGVPGLCAKVCSGASDCSADLECRMGVDIGSIIDQLGNLAGDAGLPDAGGATQNVPTTCQTKLESVNLANGIVGKACAEDTECGEGTCRKSLLGTTYTGGYCTGDCYEAASCGNTGGCGRSGILATLGAPGSCLLKCTANSDCRTGYTCRESVNFYGAGTYCLPAPPSDGGVPGADGGASDGGNGDAGVPADSGATDSGTDATAP